MDHRRARRLLPLIVTAGLGGVAMLSWQIVTAVAPATGPGLSGLGDDPRGRTAEEARPVAAAEGATPDSGPTAAMPAWRSDEVMVSAAPGVSLEAVAADHGTSLRRPAGRSGYAPMRVPAGVDRDALLAALLQDDRVATADRAGFVYGAGGDSTDSSGEDGERSAEEIADLQWHLDAMHAPTGGRDVSGVVVAVIDTGVAFEDYTDGGVTYAAAPSLLSSAIVAPYDFVNDDPHPNDDHQHGTHIASLIASDGEVMGVAPGAALMPLKVLDASNSGSEVDLVEAITWAVDEGADVINMSLAFSEGYAPSGALRGALEDAHDAGVLMIAAAGNGGDVAALYPAASPLVMSVGASVTDGSGALSLAWYSNISPTIDVLAPGGDITVDLDGNGVVDGVLAETINPDDPAELGYWLYAGTSQATALVTGTAVHLIANGGSDLSYLTHAIQAGADGDDSYGPYYYYDGQGAGDLNAEGALSALSAKGKAVTKSTEYHVSVMPYLRQASYTRVQPYVELKALDADGDPIKNLILVGSMWGSSGDSFYHCQTKSDGTCLVKGTTITHTSRGATRSLAWGVSVDAAYTNTARKGSWQSAGRPTSTFYATDGLALLTEALAEEDLLWDTPLAIYWPAGVDAELGKLFASYAVVNMASGGALRPEGLLFTTPAIEDVAEVTDLSLDLSDLDFPYDGVAPGTLDVRLVEISALGIESDPFGYAPRRIVAINGEGIESDPFGVVLKPRSLYITGEGIESDPFGIVSGPVLLSKSLIVSGSFSAMSLTDLVESGGWLDEDGYPGATALMSSGAVGMSWSEPALSSGATGAVSLDD